MSSCCFKIHSGGSGKIVAACRFVEEAIIIANLSDVRVIKFNGRIVYRSTESLKHGGSGNNGTSPAVIFGRIAAHNDERNARYYS